MKNVNNDSNDDPEYEVEETESESIASSNSSDISDINSEDSDFTNLKIKLKEAEIELKYERLNTIEKLKLYDFKLQFYMQYKYMYYISLLMNISLIVTHIVSLPDLLQESTSYLL